MPKDGGFLLPTNPSTEDMTCIRINLPNDPNYRRAFWGALWELTYYSNWQQGNQAALDIIIPRMETMWWDAVESWNPGDGECEVFDIRVIGGMLQKTYNAGIDWLDVSPIQTGNPIQEVVTLTLAAGEDATATLVNGTLTLGIPRGANGAQGIQGIQGVPGDNGTPGAAGADAGNVPVGTIIYWAGNGDIPGWLRANGQNVEIATYPELYAVCGTTYGVGTETQFRVPNIVAKYIRGVDEGGGRGGTGGASTVTLTEAQLPVVDLSHSHVIQPHTHTVAKRNGSAAGNNNSAMAANATGSADTMNTGSSGAPNTDSVTLGFGSGTAHENEPPYIKLQPMIKALPDAEPMNVEFQVTGCDLEWRKDGGAWSVLVDLSECTTPGEQGIQGIQGEQGEPGDPGDCECSDSPPPIDNEAETWCGIAKQIATRLTQYMNDAIEAIDATASFAAALSSLFSTIPVIGWETDAVAETIIDMTNLTTNQVQAEVTQPRIDEATERLFQAIVTNGGWDWDMFGQWILDEQLVWLGELLPGMGIWVSGALGLSRSDWERQAYIGSLSPSEECGVLGCDDTAEKLWLPENGGISDVEAFGTIDPSPATGTYSGLLYYPYTSPQVITFTLDTPMWCNAVEVGFWRDERPIGECVEGVHMSVNDEPLTESNRGNLATSAPPGKDQETDTIGLAIPKLVTKVNMWLPDNTVFCGQPEEFFLYKITFNMCQE